MQRDLSQLQGSNNHNRGSVRISTEIGLVRVDFDDAEMTAGLQHHGLYVADMGFAIDAFLAQRLLQVRDRNSSTLPGLMIDKTMIHKLRRLPFHQMCYTGIACHPMRQRNMQCGHHRGSDDGDCE